ncbi:phosphotransferase [Streptomyces sp. WZ-12]|uniref:phosphotransferase n=1 Tax=Streptomyces sp. WZ-12 TaxID=3030210 RepID=UPI00406CD7E3
MIIRHGDLGPWNSTWSGDRLSGFIDWDFAAPGHALDDLTQLAWYTVPLRPVERQRKDVGRRRTNPERPPQRAVRRLRGAPGGGSRRAGGRPVPRGRTHRTARPARPRALGIVPRPRRCGRDEGRAHLAPIATLGSPRWCWPTARRVVGPVGSVG